MRDISYLELEYWYDKYIEFIRKHYINNNNYLDPKFLWTDKTNKGETVAMRFIGIKQLQIMICQLDSTNNMILNPQYHESFSPCLIRNLPHDIQQFLKGK